ncbi:hypothetical protein Ct61P_03286 [Colletotrichum tofieldiae]|nr:hypothetical protein Ct61P_03286 [Colletotrichum tofieldiae]
MLKTAASLQMESSEQQAGQRVEEQIMCALSPPLALLPVPFPPLGFKAVKDKGPGGKDGQVR